MLLRNILLNLRGTVHKVVAPELEGRILDELYEGNEKTPGVWPVHDQPLQQYPERPSSSCPGVTANVCVCVCVSGSPGDLLLDGLRVGLSKQVEHGAAKVMGVAVGVAQLVGNGVQEEVTPCRHTHEEKAQSPNTHTQKLHFQWSRFTHASLAQRQSPYFSTK